MCPVPRFLCLCLCRCLPKPSTMGLFALVRGSRFPAGLLTSSPPPGIPAPHPLPSFQVQWKHTASFTFLQRSDKDTSHQLQTGDTGGVGTMTNETVSMSSKRSSCHSVPGCVARSSHLWSQKFQFFVWNLQIFKYWQPTQVSFKPFCQGTSLAFQWLRLHTSNAGGAGLILGQGTKIPHGQNKKGKKKKKQFSGHKMVTSNLKN